MNTLVASTLIGISESTLRKWEKEFEVEVPRVSGVREYHQDHIDIFNRIKECKEQNMSFIDIKFLVDHNILKSKVDDIKMNIECDVDSRKEEETQRDNPSLNEMIDMLLEKMKVEIYKNREQIYRIEEEIGSTLSSIEKEIRLVNNTLSKINNKVEKGALEVNKMANSFNISLQENRAGMRKDVCCKIKVQKVASKKSIKLQLEIT